MTIVGIDFGMVSPAICIYQQKTAADWSIDSCQFHFFHSPKKIDQETFRSLGLFAYEPYSKRIEIAGLSNNNIDRFRFLSDWVFSCIKSVQSSISKIWIEGYSYGSTSSRIFEIGENMGILKYILSNNGLSFSVVPPKTIKKFSTNYGNASKQMLEESFLNETKIDLRLILQQTAKQYNPSSDIIDAYYITKYGFHESLTPASKLQQSI